MITEAEALERILTAVAPGPAEPVPLLQACGRVNRDAIRARVALPRFDHSAMDGFAIHAADCGKSGCRLGVSGEQAAGEPCHTEVTPGSAVRIFTGAIVPRHAAAVVMQEDVEIDAEGRTIRIMEAAEPGEFIRLRGADVTEDSIIVSAGDGVNPQRIGLLASQGIETVLVGRRPRVTVLTTGDELVPPGRELPHEAAIFDSNGAMLSALAVRCGAESVTRTHCDDDADRTAEAIGHALAGSDVLLIAGGVSVGARDFVKSALARLGCPVALWRVAVRPGKPFLFGGAPQPATHSPTLTVSQYTHPGSSRDTTGPFGGLEAPPCLIFGLPGNPVSAFVTFALFVAPAVRQWQGARREDAPLPRHWARVAERIVNRGDRPHYVRGRIDSTGDFHPAGLQESHAIFGLSQSTALARIEPDSSLEPPDLVPVLPI